MESLWQNKMNKESRDECTSFGEVVSSKIRKLPTAYERYLVRIRLIHCSLKQKWANLALCQVNAMLPQRQKV
jgi:hypothetical protein